MQKHAAFWLTLSLRPDYLVLDEPVDGLDPVMRRQIWSLALEDVAGYGMWGFCRSPIFPELEDICDHVGIMHMGHMLLERSLSDLQDNFVKVQLVTENPLPQSLQILHESTLGRVQTLILRGDPQTVADELAASAPMLCDLLPLSLEEIFIYELGGTGYDVKKISCFDRAVFRRALKMTAPVWILYALYELLLPLRLFSFCRGLSSGADNYIVQIEKNAPELCALQRLHRSVPARRASGMGAVFLAVPGGHGLFLRCAARAARDAVSDELSDGRAAVRCARALVVAAFYGRWAQASARRRSCPRCRSLLRRCWAFCCFSRLRCWSAALWGRWLRCPSSM